MLLAIVIAAMVGALIGRRFRTVAIDGRTPDPHAGADPRHGREAVQPIPKPEAMAAATVAQATSGEGTPAGPSSVPGVAAGVAAGSMAHVASAPPSAAGPAARPGPAFTLADPLARTAVPRAAAPDESSSATFAGPLAGAGAAAPEVTPGEPARAAASPTAGGSPIVDAQPDEWRSRANPAIKVRARRTAAGPKPEGRRARDWALNLTLIAAIAVVGAIAFSAFIWSPPDGEIALVTQPPEDTGLPVALGDTSPDPSGRTDEFAVVGLDTSTPPVTGDQTAGTDTGGTDATPGTGSGGGRPSSRPPVGPTPTPGGGGGATPGPTSPPTPDPTTPPTPKPTPTPTDPPTPAPTATPKPPIVAFGATVDGLTVSFANRTKNAASWQWSFGDGSTSTARNPSHTYDSPGTYSVRLDATSNDGATDSLTKGVTVGG